jgi:hypothetical protein
MQIYRDKNPRASRRGLVAAAISLVAILVLSLAVQASADPLKGGSVVIQLQNSRGLKLSPKTLNLPISGGDVDPTNGSGTVQVAGGFKAKKGKGKARVTITALNLGANGGQGSLAAKVGKRKVSVFASLAGGTVARQGFGAKISNIKATLSGKGASALNAAFNPKKGKASAAAKKGVKAGQPLGNVVSIVTDPLAVGVVPGSGSLTVGTNLGGSFAAKLPKHCISLTGGVTAIPPGVMNLVPVGSFTFPVTGGNVATDFSAGEVLTGGGQKLSKDDGLGTPGACAAASPPPGTSLSSTEIGLDFAHNALNSTAALPTGASLRAPLADVDFSTGTRTFDPSTNTISVMGATAKLSFPAALTLNQFFPTESGNPSDDFVGGDEIGTVDLTGVKLR